MRAFLIKSQKSLLANESHKSELLRLELLELSLLLLELSTLLLELLLELLLSLLSLLSLLELLLDELLSSDADFSYEVMVFSTCLTASSLDLVPSRPGA